MRYLLILLIVMVALVSCDSNSSDETKADSDTVAVIETVSTPGITDVHYFWVSDPAPGGIKMKRTEPVGADSLTIEYMISRLNTMYPEVKLEYRRRSGDSVFINIPKSNYLTQQMGSTGAEAYLAEVTYNLTEVTGVNKVDIKFREGDHATPRTYSRIDFVHAPN